MRAAGRRGAAPPQLQRPAARSISGSSRSTRWRGASTRRGPSERRRRRDQYLDGVVAQRGGDSWRRSGRHERRAAARAATGPGAFAPRASPIARGRTSRCFHGSSISTICRRCRFRCGRAATSTIATSPAARSVSSSTRTSRTRCGPAAMPIGRMITQDNGTMVIGVVGNVRHGSLEEAGRNEMYLNYHQSDDWSGMEMVVRSARPPEALVREVRAALTRLRSEPAERRLLRARTADRQRRRATPAHDAAARVLLGAGADTGRARPVRRDRLHRRAAHAGDRHPHGDRRAAPGRADARGRQRPQARRRRYRDRPRRRVRAHPRPERACCSASPPTTRSSSPATPRLLMLIATRRVRGPGAACHAREPDHRAAGRIAAVFQSFGGLICGRRGRGRRSNRRRRGRRPVPRRWRNRIRPCPERRWWEPRGDTARSACRSVDPPRAALPDGRSGSWSPQRFLRNGGLADNRLGPGASPDVDAP